MHNHGLFFFLNLPRLTSLSCFWKAFLEKPMLTFLEQIFLASCLYNRRLSTTSFHCLQTWKLLVKKQICGFQPTSSTASSSLKLRCRKISSRTSGLRRASGWNKTTSVELDGSLLDEQGGDETSFVSEGCVDRGGEVPTEILLISGEGPSLAITPRGLTHVTWKDTSSAVSTHSLNIHLTPYLPRNSPPHVSKERSQPTVVCTLRVWIGWST